MLTRSFSRGSASLVIKEHFCLLAKAKEYICQSLDTPLQVYAPDMNSVTSQWEKFLLVPIVKRLAAHQCLYPITGLMSCLSFSVLALILGKSYILPQTYCLSWVKSLGARSRQSVAILSTMIMLCGCV